jgi:hypothetical protein
MKQLYYLLIGACLISGCANLDSADPSERKTFVKFYEGASSMTAAAIEPTPDGFVILANVQQTINANTEYFTVVFEVDQDGNKTSDFISLPGGIGKDIKRLPSGYIIVGDSIFVNSEEEQAANVTVTSLRTLILDNSFTKQRAFFLSDTITNAPIKRDYFGGAVTLTPDGRMVVLGTFKEGVVNQLNAPEKQLIIVLNSDFTINWANSFNLEDNTYQNSRSVHFSPTGKIIWATSIADIQGSFTRSWLAIPVVEDSSIYKNFSPFGQTSTQLMVPGDIKPSINPGLGYGVVGTYSLQTDGSGSNIFFAKVFADGTVDASSVKYFDGISSFENIQSINQDESQILDQGKTLCATNDAGFVIAGSMTTNPSKGNGGKDIFLIKVDAFGNPQWMKTLGGTGDEEVASVIQTEDGDLLICGTSTIGDYSSIFLMKTDNEGNLKN